MWIYIVVAIAILIVLYYCISFHSGTKFYNLKTGATMSTPSYFPIKTFIAFTDFANGFQKLLRNVPEKVIRLNIFGTMNWVICGNASEARRILISKDKFSRVKQISEKLKDIMPLNGIGTPDEAEWKRQRKHLITCFDMTHLEKLIPIFQDSVEVLLRMIQNNQEQGNYINAADQFGFVATDIIGKSAFGFDFHATETNGKSEFVKQIAQLTSTASGLAILPGFFKTPWGKKMLSSLNQINKVCYEVISSRRKEMDSNSEFKHNDLLEIMLMKDNDGNPVLNDLQVRDNAFFFLMAGAETTSLLVSNLLYLLCKHTQVQQKLQKEVRECMDSLSGYFTIHKLNEMEYLNACIKEALRLYPPAVFTAREVRDANETVAGYSVPAKSVILIPIRSIQTDEDYFGADALEFKPERWLDINYSNQVQNYYFPFGGGAFDCVGKRMAMLEAKVIVSLLMNKFTVELKDPNYSIHFKRQKLLKPDGLVLKFVNK